MKENYLGLNMGSLQAVFEESPVEKLKALSQIGYKGLEVTCPLPLPVNEYVNLSKDLDLATISLHAAPPKGGDDLKRYIDFVKSIDCDRIVLGCLHPVELRCADDYKRQAEIMNEYGEKIKAQGVRAFYHNHEWELRKFNDTCGLEIMMEGTDPDCVHYEVDVCWMTVGGADPAEFLRKYANRCPLVHYKDILIRDGYSPGYVKNGIIQDDGYSLIEGSYELVEAGLGVVDLKKVWEAVDPRHVEWLISEQDRSALPPMESARVNYANYKGLGIF